MSAVVPPSPADHPQDATSPHSLHSAHGPASLLHPSPISAPVPLLSSSVETHTLGPSPSSNHHHHHSTAATAIATAPPTPLPRSANIPVAETTATETLTDSTTTATNTTTTTTTTTTTSTSATTTTSTLNNTSDPTSSSLMETTPLTTATTNGHGNTLQPTHANTSPPNTPTTSAVNTTSSSTTGVGATVGIPVRKRTLADYKLGRTLGEGSYSTVVDAIDLSNRRNYAIKVLDKRHIIREKKVKYVNIEKNTLYKLDHPGVVKLFSTFQDSSSLYYVLELCQNGELLTFIKKLGSFDENCTRFYAAQILTAIEYVHSQGVIHRDLKPENILLDHRMYIKLTDFGTAKMLEPSEDGSESDRANSFVGTAEYVSPELLTEKAACKSSDLWALGCIIYQLLAGRPPFKGSNEYQTFQKIVKLEYTFPAGFPKTAMDLVSRLLVHDPNERLGANNTIEKLKQHPFFEGVQWDDLWNQPAPKLMPYLPPTPAHNTEALRSDHDACLWDVNRTGEALMVVDPFRELGDSGSSLDNSGRNSMNDSDEGHHQNGGVQDVHRQPVGVSAAAMAPASRSQPELSGLGDKADPSKSTTDSGHAKKGSTAKSAHGAISKSSPGSSTGSPLSKSSSVLNGHVKNKSSSRNAFVALFTPNPKVSSSKKSANDDSNKKSKQPKGIHEENVEQLDGGWDGNQKTDTLRENSTVSLAVTANEISAYSKRAQLELQAELSPWHSFLMPTELIIFQTPVLKRKGLFSRSCILVLTDFPRLLYFDDSNHYFSQLFNSNTNDGYSCWHQQQRVAQWEKLEQQHRQFSLAQQLGGFQPDPSHRMYQHPSLSQDSQNHQQQQINALHQPLSQPGGPHGRRSTSGRDAGSPTTASGFMLTRNASGNQRHQQARSEHVSSQILSEHDEEGLRPVRTSLEHAPHQYPHQHGHPHPHQTHHRQQSNGYNRIDVEKRVSASDPTSGPLSLAGSITSPLSTSHGQGAGGLGSRANAATAAVVGTSNNTERGFKSAAPSASALPPINTNMVATSNTNRAPAVTGVIKASKRQAKLRGEILFTASVISEEKGKKCFFIHTTKKSYYFEECREGDAKLWVRVLERCMEEWFGERAGITEAKGSGKEKARRHSKPVLE